MKKLFGKLLATIAAASLTFSIVACTGETGGTNGVNGGGANVAAAESVYLAIDINPSVELIIKDGKVSGVTAANEDGAVLLSGETLEGMSVEAATDRIVALAEELGFLTDENNQVKITVVSDDAKAEEAIFEKAQKGAKKGSDKAEVNRNPRSADEKKVKELQAENPELYKFLTPAKLRLIEAIMQYDDSMTYEVGAGMRIKDLAERLDELEDDFEDVIGDELEEKFEARKDELKAETERKIAAVYGDEYLAAWEKYSALKAVYKEIEKRAEHAPVSEEDLAAIEEILKAHGIDGGKDKPEKGFSAEELEDYFDRMHDSGKFDRNHNHNDRFEGEHDRDDNDDDDDDVYEDAEDAIEEILDKYDEDAYLLTEEDLAAIAAAYGEGVEATSLEDLEEFIEGLEEALETLRDSIELTKEQKAEIQKIREEMKGIAGKVHGEMKEEIDRVKEEFRAQKDALRK